MRFEATAQASVTLQTESRHRIAHIITGLAQGGAQGALAGLVAATCARWDSVVISLTDAGFYGERLRAAGVPVLCCEMTGASSFPRGLARLYRFLSVVRPDVVQTWMYHADLFGGTAARMAGCRSVLWGIRNLSLPPGRVSRSVRVAARLCAALSPLVPSLIVSVSSEAARAHQALGYTRQKFRIIPNGYDCAQLRPDAAAGARVRGEWGVAAGEPLLGMVARWDPLKDHRNLFAALERMKGEAAGVRCVLIGEGMSAANSALAELAGRFGLKEQLILAGPRPDIAAVMNALDLHVLSSSSEAFPNVLAEAMACGTPCVATDVGDARRIIGEAGWLAPAGDPAALASALQSALAQIGGAGREGLRRACRARIVENFTHQAMVAAFEGAWLSTMRGGLKAQGI